MAQTRDDFARLTLQLAVDNVRQGGGPFAAIVVRQGEVLATGQNRVTFNHDPTAHAEVQAIREACRKLGNFELRDCELYTSCEPCPMCLGAIYWARLGAVNYCASRLDAAGAGFDDSLIYEEAAKALEQRRIPFRRVLSEESFLPFRVWAEKSDKVRY